MSEMQYLFQVNLKNSGMVPHALNELLSLSWLYQHLENFQTPSPDHKIDLQKKHGKRIPIIAKASIKVPESCFLLSSTPSVQTKPQPKAEMQIINTTQ